MKVMIIPIVIGALGTVIKKLEELGNNRSNGDNLNYCFIEIDQNTKKSPGDLKKLFITQTPLKTYQPTLVGKTL